MTSPWEIRFSNSRQLPYFFNNEDKRSEWSVPRGFSDVTVRQLRGAEQYLTPLDPRIHKDEGPAGQAGELFKTKPHAKPVKSEEAAEVARSRGQQVQRARAMHILAKHRNSRRPSSWREDVITRSLEEAHDIIQGHIDRLSAVPESQLQTAFASIAKTESDCSSAKKGGDLGDFVRGQMQASFEEACFSLRPGQMSGIVDTDSGTHVILRLA